MKIFNVKQLVKTNRFSPQGQPPTGFITINYRPELTVVDFKNSIQNQKLSLYEKTDFWLFTKVLLENLYIRSKLIFLDLLNNDIPGAT